MKEMRVKPLGYPISPGFCFLSAFRQELKLEATAVAGILLALGGVYLVAKG